MFSFSIGLFYECISQKIEFLAEDLGLLDAYAYLSYFSKSAYNFTQLELLKFYFLTTAWTTIS